MRTFKSSCISIQYKRVDVSTVTVIIIIIIIERKDLGGVMSKDCKDTLQTLKYSTMSVQCQFPQWGPRQSPGGKRILAHF